MEATALSDLDHVLDPILDYSVLICPSLVPHQRIKVIIEAKEHKGIHVIYFEVDGHPWAYLVHSAHYLALKGIELSQGWYQIHPIYREEDSIADIRLCLCEEHHHMSFHWEYGFYMNKIIDIYCTHWEEHQLFPTPQEIRILIRPYVQLVKGSRSSVPCKVSTLQDFAYRLVEQTWDEQTKKITDQVRSFADIPMGVTCIEKLAENCKQLYLASDEFDTFQLMICLEQAHDFFYLLQREFDEHSSSWCMSKTYLRNFCRKVLKETGFFWTPENKDIIMQHYQCIHIGSYLTEQVGELIETICKKRKEKRNLQRIMTIPLCCFLWKWRAIRNQNHPDILQKRGVFNLIDEYNKELQGYKVPSQMA